MMIDNWHPTLRRLLEYMPVADAADLYLIAGANPVYRIHGVGHPVPDTHLEGHDIQEMAYSLLDDGQRAQFGESPELNLSLCLEDARFRVSIFRQRGAVAMVIRLIRSQIKSLDELGHPAILKRLASSKRGLILLVGGTGSGKSTTLAAMIDHRNASATGHILTIEDPIEFVHPHKQCVISQREVGVDTDSYAAALKSSLRQAPDVILIGEIRDYETMEAAIAFAETGHLCLSTLHANNANQALERILNFFPAERHPEILAQLALNVRAIISQRLLPASNGGRAAALEILIDTPRIKELIKRGEIDVIKDAMEQGRNEGCQTFDAAIFELLKQGQVKGADALVAADSPNNLRIRVERFRGAATAEHGLRLLA